MLVSHSNVDFCKGEEGISKELTHMLKTVDNANNNRMS